MDAKCGKELENVRATGKLNPRGFLHAVLRAIALSFKVDVQLIESVNSMIRLLGLRCRNMSLELLFSRIFIKKTINPDSSMKTQWSFIKSHMSVLFQTCLQQSLDDDYRKRLLAMSSSCRWSSPTPLTDAEVPAKVTVTPTFCSGAAWRWAKRQVSSFHKLLKAQFRGFAQAVLNAESIKGELGELMNGSAALKFCYFVICYPVAHRLIAFFDLPRYSTKIESKAPSLGVIFILCAIPVSSVQQAMQRYMQMKGVLSESDFGDAESIALGFVIAERYYASYHGKIWQLRVAPRVGEAGEKRLLAMPPSVQMTTGMGIVLQELFAGLHSHLKTNYGLSIAVRLKAVPPVGRGVVGGCEVIDLGPSDLPSCACDSSSGVISDLSSATLFMELKLSPEEAAEPSDDDEDEIRDDGAPNEDAGDSDATADNLEGDLEELMEEAALNEQLGVQLSKLCTVGELSR